jgi:hypothetical protein
VERSNEARGDRARSSGFFEVDPQQFSVPCGVKQTMIELSRADGTRLVVQMNGPDSIDVLGLAEIVMGRRP